MNRFAQLFALLLCGLSAAGEQVDLADAQRQRAGALKITLRVRVAKVVPEEKTTQILWRRGGEGLGGEVVRGEFTADDKAAEIAVGSWSAPLPLDTIVGRARGWEFPTIVVTSPRAKKKAPPILESEIAFEFSENGKVFKSFTEPSPKGATAGFAFPGGLLGEKGEVTPEFTTQLQGLSTYARARRERIEKLFAEPAPLPKQFAIVGRLGGYGEGSGYGIRHCNPEICADECRVLRLLGVNGLTAGVRLADAAGMGDQFRRIYWGGPGSGSPMNFFMKKGAREADGCPFEPALKPHMAQQIEAAIADHRAIKAQESWGLWWDEIGVAAKEHLANCPRCADEFRVYLKSQNLEPAAFGKANWGEIVPYPMWKPAAPADAKIKRPRGEGLDVPTSPEDCLRFYYTHRFMTCATAKLFPEAAQQLKAANISLYAMQGPTPSWSGHSLDWHEFYDLGANTALVWETSNRDPRVWQWESYLADIMRGISQRHSLPIGCLIKPHRGAPEQRMLSVVARGAGTFEWYTYGPDYSKGDSFSQRPDLLDSVARAGRFLGQNENQLYGATWAAPAEVAFVSPRSSEIWGKSSELGLTSFEDAKWVYLALAHAHIPADILSEQQLAEGKLERYKAIYIPGTNLRKDAAAKVKEWVGGGGTLWTDALGLARDEANQPATALDEVLGLGERKLETWGSVDGYKATDIKPLTETNAPASATFSWDAPAPFGKGQAQAGIGREGLKSARGESLAKFNDGARAVVRQKFGKGEAIICGFWAGLTYSAKVRRADYDMRADFDSALRDLIAAPALSKNVYRPVIPAEPLVEAVGLQKDGKRSVALINWAYTTDGADARRKARLQTFENLRIALPGPGEIKAVRSANCGALTIECVGAERSVVLPKLSEIDLLIIE